MLGKFLRALGLARLFMPRSSVALSEPDAALAAADPPVPRELPVLLNVFIDALKDSEQPHEAHIGQRMEERVQRYQQGNLDHTDFTAAMLENINALRVGEVDDNLAGLLDLLEADIIAAPAQSHPG